MNKNDSERMETTERCLRLLDYSDHQLECTKLYTRPQTALDRARAAILMDGMVQNTWTSLESNQCQQDVYP